MVGGYCVFTTRCMIFGRWSSKCVVLWHLYFMGVLTGAEAFFIMSSELHSNQAEGAGAPGRYAKQALYVPK